MPLEYYSADCKKTARNDPKVAFFVNSEDNDKNKIIAAWRERADQAAEIDGSDADDPQFENNGNVVFPANETGNVLAPPVGADVAPKPARTGSSLTGSSLTVTPATPVK